jgi:hypothetical protein
MESKINYLKTLTAAAAISIAMLASAKALEIGDTFRVNDSLSVTACKTLEQIRTGDTKKCGSPDTSSIWEVTQKSGDAICFRAASHPEDACYWAVIPNTLFTQVLPPRAPAKPAPDRSEADGKAESAMVLIWYHKTCQTLFKPTELPRFIQLVQDGSPSALQAGAQTVANGLSMWGGERRYCQMLTLWIKDQLPEIGRRLSDVK